MPPTKAQSTLLNLVNSELEDESSDFSTAARSRPAATMPVKRPRGRPAGSANKVAKPGQKSTSRRSSGRIAAAAAAEIENEEASGVLSDKNNKQNVAASKRTARGGAKNVEKPKPGRGRPRAVAKSSTEPMDIGKDEDDDIASNMETHTSLMGTKGRRGRKPNISKTEIPETQVPEEMDVDEERDELEELPQKLPSDPIDVASSSAVVPSSARSQRMVDIDGNESTIRRRLGDLSKKYDILESKYRHLQEVGTREAERNFDRLKKQAEERAQSECRPY